MHVLTQVVGLIGIKIVEYILCGIGEMMHAASHDVCPFYRDACPFYLHTGQTHCVDSITKSVDSNSITTSVDSI